MRAMGWVWCLGLAACMTGRGTNGEDRDDTSVLDPDDENALASVVVDAGVPQEVFEGDTVSLVGTVANAGSQSSVRWSQDAGPTVTLDLPGATTTTFVAPAVAEDTLFVFTLEGLDRDAVVAKDDTSVLVRSKNLPPVVDAGVDQEVDEETPVVLAGTASDADGSIATIDWIQLSGPVVTLSGPDPLAPRFDAPVVAADATLVFSLEVTDEDGATASDEVVIDVTPVNVRPVVDAGADQTVNGQSAVRLDGSATDSDGLVRSTLWVQTLGPVVTLDDATSLAPGFTAPNAGIDVTLGFRLEAIDDEGALAVDTMTVTVLTTNQAPTVDAGQDLQVLEDDVVTVSGVVSDDGTVASHRWVQITGPSVVLDDPYALETTFTAPGSLRPTTVGLRLEVTDDLGVTGSDTVYITVTPLNTLPEVDAGPDQAVDEEVLVTLDGDASDVDGTIASVLWEQTRGPTVTLSDPTVLAPTFTSPAVIDVTSLVFVLRVTDDQGAQNSDAMSVRVAPLNLRPSANAGANQNVTEGSEVTLYGVATDADGVVARVGWTEVTAVGVTLSDSTVLQPTFTAPFVTFPQRITFEFEVEDDEGGIATDRVDVVVEPDVIVNNPPSVYAGPNRTVGSGSGVGLVGQAEDEDGYIDQLSWVQTGGPEVALTAGGSLTPQFTAPEVACAVVLTFALSATDNEGATVTDEVSIVVEGLTEAEPLTLPVSLDLEEDLGGIVLEGDAWQWGVPTSGPEGAYEGTRVLATNLAGNYGPGAFDIACFPPVDLTGKVDPVMSFRAYLRLNSGDGLVVEGLDPNAGWVPLTDALPSPTRVVEGRPSWGDTGYTETWWLHAVSLPSWLGNQGRVRVVFTSNNSYFAAGAYLDQIRIDEDATDPDGDDLVGILDEWGRLGLDPFDPDSDGDGVDDGDEILGGTNPLNPADFPGRPTLVPGFVLDFDQNADGVVSSDAMWQHGSVASGPERAASGSQAWATVLDGNYWGNRRSYLYIPPIDLGDTADPTLAFQLWMGGNSGDGLSVEIYDPVTSSWSQVDADVPPYDGTDALGSPAWRSQAYRKEYGTAAVSLAPWSGDTVFVRFAFRTDNSYFGAGAYLDDLAVYDESDDPDEDGVLGILGELAIGTEPFVPDSDGDGTNDGDEVAAGTDPVDGAVYPGVPKLVPGTTLDFESGPQGLASSSSDWEHGVVASGPGRATSGIHVWASNLDGAYPANVREVLHLPPIDLTGVDVVEDGAPVLSFRLWASASSGDGVSAQAWSDTEGWVTLDPAHQPYDSTDALGGPAWRNQRYRTAYRHPAFDLSAFAGQEVRVRFTLRTDNSYDGPGFYLDDLALYLESHDPDGDGFVGILAELAAGTDPFVADSDGDGSQDGAERDAGTDPTDPAWSPDLPMMVPGAHLDFESGPQGVAATSNDWQHGGIAASGPGHAWSGIHGWGTNLTGDYAANLRESLYLPPIDLRSVTDPGSTGHATLSFRVWMLGTTGDGVSVEVWTPEEGWVSRAPDLLAYDSVDGVGAPAWRYQRPYNEYQLAAFSLEDWAGDIVRVRITFRSSGSYEAAGAYLDDVRVDLEGDDPDADGLAGVLAEVVHHGTDPYLPDSDLDGFLDGEEDQQGTDPRNGAWHPDTTWLSVGDRIDFELDDGGVAATGVSWAIGTPGSGPRQASSGTRVWATVLGGVYEDDRADALMLPPADLIAATAPTLSFRLWLDAHSGDGLGLDAQLVDGSWTRVLADDVVPYDVNDPTGAPSFRDVRVDDDYVLVTFDLSAFVGRIVPLRVMFRSDASYESSGAYLDDLGLHDEDDDPDPDGDGLLGIYGEYATYGTDPFLPDSDFDGFDDDVEIGVSDPLDPASTPDSP